MARVSKEKIVSDLLESWFKSVAIECGFFDMASKHLRDGVASHNLFVSTKECIEKRLEEGYSPQDLKAYIFGLYKDGVRGMNAWELIPPKKEENPLARELLKANADRAHPALYLIFHPVYKVINGRPVEVTAGSHEPKVSFTLNDLIEYYLGNCIVASSKHEILVAPFTWLLKQMPLSHVLHCIDLAAEEGEMVNVFDLARYQSKAQLRVQFMSSVSQGV